MRKPLHMHLSSSHFARPDGHRSRMSRPSALTRPVRRQLHFFIKAASVTGKHILILKLTIALWNATRASLRSICRPYTLITCGCKIFSRVCEAQLPNASSQPLRRLLTEAKPYFPEEMESIIFRDNNLVTAGVWRRPIVRLDAILMSVSCTILMHVSLLCT